MTIELFVSGGDATEFLEPPEKPLDEIARLVQPLAVAPRCDAIGPWRDDRLGALVVQQFNERVSVVALVGDHGGGLLGAGDQRGRFGNVGFLPAGEREGDRVALLIGKHMELGAPAAAGVSEALRAVFFSAPAACGWARTIVLSMNTARSCGSALRCCSSPSQRSERVQRRNRTKVVCQLPSSAGKSRQGAPVRSTHSTASMNRRLSFAWRPGSPGLPGSSGSMNAHWAAVSSWRFILIGIQRTGCKQILRQVNSPQHGI